jgi:acyl-CoA thioesterase-1
MLKSLIVALLMFVSATAGSVEAASKVILVYGDSLSAGYGIRVEQSWPSLLGDRLKEDTRVGAGGTPSWTVANASISGETTAGGRSRLEVALRQFKPKVVVLALGANDGLRGLPVKQMQDNLISMVKLAKASGARVLLIGMRLPPNYGPEYTNAFEAAFTATARLEKVALLPFLLEPVAGQRSNFQADGLHPISAAQTKLLDHIYPALQPLLK